MAQRAKLVLQARENLLTKDVRNDYYLTVKSQKSLTLADLAREVAATHGHQNATEVEMLTSEVMELANWYLSSGYGITCPLGHFHTTVSGVLLDSELGGAPPRDRLKLSVAHTVSHSLRTALDEAELDVEIDKAKTGPQLYTVISAADAAKPGATTRAEGTPISAGETCILKGKNAKVGGPAESKPGITLTRVDKSGTSPIFIPAAKLYPNTPTQVGFIMPADAVKGSTWEISLCTQLSGNGTLELKSPRTVRMDGVFVVGEVAPNPDSGGGDPVNPFG